MKPNMYLNLFLALVAGTVAITASSAWANTAANTQITNNATLTYNDGSGVKTSTVGITVTVSLVPSPPNFILGGAQTTSYSGTATATDSYTLTATSNGPDTYTLSGNATVPAGGNTFGPGATPTQATVYLGATVTANGSTTTDLFVPADGNNLDNKVNGIGIGTIVVINGEQKNVIGITDNATGISHIFVSALGAAPGVGIVIGERYTINVTVTPGAIATPGTNVQVNANLTATSQTLGSVTATSGNVLNTFTSGTAALTKFVRNISTPNHTGVDLPHTYGGNNYYAQGVSAKPGEILEYILVATTSTASVSAASIVDLLPIDYVTLRSTIAGAPYLGKDIVYVDEAAATTPLTAAGDVDAATYDSTFDLATLNAHKGKLVVNVGAGATSGAGGTVPAATIVRVLYQATVKP